MEVEQLLKLYAAGRRDFSWADLRGTVLNQAKLKEINLYRAKLDGANLAGADLSHANLRGANLSAAVLTGACLRSAQLMKADLSKAKLNESDLTKADLSGIQLIDADLVGANLTQAKLYKANLTGAVLLGANLEAVDFTGAELAGAVMPDGTPYEEWRLLHLQEDTEAEAEIEADLPPQEPIIESEVVEEFSLPAVSIKPLTTEEIWQCLPLPSLSLLFLGYIFFGEILARLQAPEFCWLLTWLGSIGWVARESLTWFVPVSGSVAIFMALIFSLPGMGGFLLILFVAVSTFAVFADLWFIGFGFGSSVKDSLWIGGLIASFFVLYVFFVFGVSEGWSLGLSFVLAIVGSALGGVSWLQMEQEGLIKSQILVIFGGITAFALISGWSLGQFL